MDFKHRFLIVVLILLALPVFLFQLKTIRELRDESDRKSQIIRWFAQVVQTKAGGGTLVGGNYLILSIDGGRTWYNAKVAPDLPAPVSFPDGGWILKDKVTAEQWKKIRAVDALMERASQHDLDPSEAADAKLLSDAGFEVALKSPATQPATQPATTAPATAKSVSVAPPSPTAVAPESETSSPVDLVQVAPPAPESDPDPLLDEAILPPKHVVAPPPDVVIIRTAPLQVIHKTGIPQSLVEEMSKENDQ